MSIHDPTTPSSSTPAGPSATVHSEVQRLTTLRSNLEAQLDVYYSVLQSNNIDMHAPLVDPEGFPRADIDVAAVRTARVHIICLRNDLKAVLADMERVVQRGLPRGEEPIRVLETKGEVQRGAAEAEERTPFAKVDAVAPGSPAHAAGIARDDLLLSLGGITTSMNDTLRAVAQLVGRSEGSPLPVVLLRGDETREVTLTPRTGWGGRGLLGCHIVPYAP